MFAIGWTILLDLLSSEMVVACGVEKKLLFIYYHLNGNGETDGERSQKTSNIYKIKVALFVRK